MSNAAEFFEDVPDDLRLAAERESVRDAWNEVSADGYWGFIRGARWQEKRLANLVEPFLVDLRSAVSSAEFVDARRNLQDLFDLLDRLDS